MKSGLTLDMLNVNKRFHQQHNREPLASSTLGGAGLSVEPGISRFSNVQITEFSQGSTESRPTLRLTQAWTSNVTNFARFCGNWIQTQNFAR